RDPPAPPNLVTVTHDAKQIDAVAQVSKQGYVFVFDRVTGSPVFPIEERRVPASDIPGEQAWPTQPFPLKPAPYARQNFTEQDINPYAENREELIATFRKSRVEGPFTPLSKQGTVVFPGLDGGAEWGGAAVDPEGILYVNSNEMAWRISIGPGDTEQQLSGLTSGHRLYIKNCASCHGAERKGNPNSGFPSLLDVANHHKREYVIDVVAQGKGKMPAFTGFSTNEKKALAAFLYGDEKPEPGLTKEPRITKLEEAGLPYKISGYTRFLDKNGYPAIRPPWGTLNAIDLNTGEYIWKISFGDHPELAAKGIPSTGSQNYGGPIITASNLLFIAGTKDKKFRVYNKKNGQLLWEIELPAAGFATPSTYAVNGKQYVVIACGGTKLGSERGDSFVAFSLP
ncbi:MAG: c-type cytochrome, partial [Chitinophagaceae bacterium]